MITQSRNNRVLALAVASVDGRPELNYNRAIELLDESVARVGSAPPDIAVLPEAFAAGYCQNDLTEFDETLAESTFLQKLLELSRRYQCMMVIGFLEKAEGALFNSAAILDCGQVIGIHRKSTLWPDNVRPYRDERRLLSSGPGVDVFETRLGRVGVMICYENMVPETWKALASRVDFVLNPYNCEDEPVEHNMSGSRSIGVPSAWANRTGWVYCGQSELVLNPGTAGITDAQGNVTVKSAPERRGPRSRNIVLTTLS